MIPGLREDERTASRQFAKTYPIHWIPYSAPAKCRVSTGSRIVFQLPVTNPGGHTDTHVFVYFESCAQFLMNTCNHDIYGMHFHGRLETTQ